MGEEHRIGDEPRYTVIWLYISYMIQARLVIRIKKMGAVAGVLACEPDVRSS